MTKWPINHGYCWHCFSFQLPKPIAANNAARYQITRKLVGSIKKATSVLNKYIKILLVYVKEQS